MSIQSMQYTTSPGHHANASYDIVLEFLFEGGETTSKKLRFLDRPPASEKQGRIWDILTYNGICGGQNRVSVSPVEWAEATLACKNRQFQKRNANDPVVAMVDIQHKKHGYKREGPILEAENEILDQLRRTDTLGINTLMREGSLKCDILKTFPPESREAYFLRKTQPAFCQCAEFAMNGFKFGHTMQVLDDETVVAEFAPSSYIVHTQEETPTWPAKESTVFYPPSYAEMYGIDSPFHEALAPIHSVEIQTTPQGMTQWNIKER